MALTAWADAHQPGSRREAEYENELTENERPEAFDEIQSELVPFA